MRPLTKEQILSPKRQAEPVTLPEYSAPLLLAKPSASLAVRLRESKMDLRSPEAIEAMLTDMLVDEAGERLLPPGGASVFLTGISADSLSVVVSKCAEMFSGKAGGPGNSRADTSAA